ncbi:MAG: zinc ribbon domain-containing protein [Acidimicrobiia bacterium]|nr:zinc ribbon domain-containing protein [Acidimicrobiia bacterium]
MSDTSASLPICIHCGTPRPADETVCPECGQPWMDVRIAPPPVATPPPVGAPVAAAAAAAMGPEEPLPHDTGEFGMDDWTLPPEPPKRSAALWLIPIVLLLAVGAFWIWVVFAGGNDTTTTTQAGADTTTTAAQDTTTTVAQDTTTTTEGTTTTTLGYPPATAWPPVGDPVPQDDLGLKAAGVGPIDFGAPIAEAAGILVSSLGDAEAAGVDDACQTGDVYWLQFGPLRAIFDGFDADATFTAYRYEEAGGTADVDLATLSGIRLGDTVQELQDTYASYTVSFEVIDGQDHFRLLDGAELLLWGPVTSTDPDGTIEGIYSPTLCQTG